ncbi:MAG: acyl-[ACP]--phospholipid O-acyltransferase [Pirellulales bacterium]
MSEIENPADGHAEASANADPRGGLCSPSFLGLLATLFLGALNDNMFRWLVVPIGKYKVGDEHAAVALSAGLACFVLPYLIWAAPAGFLADRFSKRTVIVACKVAEIVIVFMGIAAIWLGNLYGLFVVVALLGSQAALFGPSKLGALPEILRPEKLSAANGLAGLTTVIAVILGTVAGNYLYQWTQPEGLGHLWVSAAALLGVAVAGWATSLLVRPLPPADPGRAWPMNPLGQTIRDIKAIGQSLPLLRVALGIAFFWSLASLAQMNVDLFGIKELDLAQKDIGPLLAVLALGVGIGSVLAGIWSAGKVELGIVPLGALGIAVSSMLLFTVPDPMSTPSTISYAWSCAWLFALGVSAGLFDVPLEAYMQHRSPAQSRGAILAASNFMTFSGMLLAAGLFWLWREPMGLSARQIFLVAGLLTLPVFVYVVWLLPGATIRFVVWLASHTIYRLRIHGRENLPEEGGALLVANHVSFLDGVMLLLASSRPVRMLAYADYIQSGWIRWLANTMGAIPIRPGRKSVVESLKTAREALRQGELVCIFPEGGITRTGQLQAFKPGAMAIVGDTGAPVIPVYLDELWGSIFSYSKGRFFWKWPKQWPYSVSILFGRPLRAPEDVHQIRQAVQDLGVEAMERRKMRKMILPRAFLRMCRRNSRRPKLADTTGAQLTGGEVLMRTLILRRLLMREVLAADEKFVGVLLPPSVGGMLANAALPLAGRIPVNLNYTVSSEVMDACLAQCGIRHVLTSRKVIERLKLDIHAELVYLEDFKDRVTRADKLAAAFQTYAVPAAVLDRMFGLTKIGPDDLLTVIFTSGSTGQPKGVMLTHYNIASNVEAIDQVIQLRASDVLVGVLPFFHSFGYTTTIWTVLSLDPKGVYHFNPLDAKLVGDLCRKHGVTILIATPTFLRTYQRRCPAEDFAALDVAFTGAEKLPVELAAAFQEKFGVRPVEGYGTTELSPVVSANIPATRTVSGDANAAREGSVGRPVPGVAAKVIDPDTGQDLGIDRPGMLLIKGPNVMLGYLGQPKLTAEVIRDGWYVTGDIATIDADGFIRITGRESRFSKIGGEMVPHILIEETLTKILHVDEEEYRACVTAVPDAKKGERIVVLHTQLDKSPEQICKELAAAGLPNLWIPSPDSFRQVDHIPVLGIGKVDLKALKNLAMERFS